MGYSFFPAKLRPSQSREKRVRPGMRLGTEADLDEEAESLGYCASFAGTPERNTINGSVRYSRESVRYSRKAGRETSLRS